MRIAHKIPAKNVTTRVNLALVERVPVLLV